MQIGKYLVASILAAFVLTGHAKECRKTGETCVDSTPSKKIGDVIIPVETVGGCWDYEETYECVDANVLDYCSPLVTIGCGVLSSNCSATAFNGSCLSFQNKYTCGVQMGAAQGVVTLDNTYTLLKEDKDTTACKSNEDNQSCQLAQEVCKDGPGYKVILADGKTRDATPAEIAAGTSVDGVVESRECWQWDRRYACISENHQNFCSPLKAAGCAETGATCKGSGWDGSCLEYERTYLCADKAEPLPTQVVHLDTSYTVTKDTKQSTCKDLESNPNCFAMGDTCVEGPATRVVRPDGTSRTATATEIALAKSADGALVTKACWRLETQYSCAQPGVNDANSCGDLEKRQNGGECTFQSQHCVDKLPSGECSISQKTYSCKSEPDKTQEITDCGTQQFCMDGGCIDSSYPPDGDIGLAIAGREMEREAGSLDIFRGEPGWCSNKAWGAGQCCKAKGGGEKGNSASIMSSAAMGAVTYAGEKVVQMGSEYLWTSLFDTFAQYTTQVMTDAAYIAAENTLFNAATASTNFSVGMYGFSWSTSSTLMGQGLGGANVALMEGQSVMGGYLYFNPYMLVAAVVIQVVMNYLECETSEQDLSMKRGQNLCHLVGSWCESKSMGSCATKKEGWCCFPSRLGRIINEQGRPQIGKTWGTPQVPDCSGFTQEELKMLRFDEMDLSEFIADIVPNAKGSTYATDRITSRLSSEPKSYYEMIKPGAL